MNYKNKIKLFRKNKDAKVLLENFLFLSFLQIAGYLFPIITIPYLAKTIGVDRFGDIAFASAVVVYFSTISDWGFNYTATRDVARHRKDKNKVSEIFSNVFWARCFLMTVSFLFLLILIFSVPKFKENAMLLLFTFFLIPGKIMFSEWFFQGLEKMKYITILSLLAKTVFTLSIFIFINKKSDFVFQPLIAASGFIFSGFISLYIIFIMWGIRLNKPKISIIFKTIKSSTDVFINNLMPNLYNSFSVLLLGFFGGSVSTGILNAGTKFSETSNALTIVISRAFFPFLSRRIDKHSFYAKTSVFSAFLMTVVLFFFSPFIINVFFTPEFFDSILVLRISSFSVLFTSIIFVYGTNFLIIKNREKDLRNATFVSSIIGFLSAVPLIYYFDYIGAALTITMSRGILCFLIVLKVYKDKETRREAFK